MVVCDRGVAVRAVVGGGDGLAVAETGAGSRNIEHLQNLSAEAASEAGVAAFRAQAPRLEVVDVGGAGHMVAGDRNDAFAGGVIAFLRQHMPAGA